jgi:hypothetical protein
LTDGLELFFSRLLRAVLFVFLAGSILAPFILKTNGISIPLASSLICFLLLLSVFLISLIYKPRLLLLLSLAVVSARLIFDFYVLPARAAIGDHVKTKSDASKIVELTKGSPLFLYGNKNEGNYSLGSVFYIERGRQEVLRRKFEKDCIGFFIAERQELDGERYKIYYSLEWRGHRHYLVKFECE